MKTYLRKIVAFINDEEGASAIEYGLLVGLIALAIVAGATSRHEYRCLGKVCSSTNMFTRASTKLDAVAP